jgi:hypothetical protein
MDKFEHMKNLNYRIIEVFFLFVIFLLASCSGSKLPKEFIGEYINDKDSRSRITIVNEDGDFVESGSDYTVKGTFQLDDISDQAGETFIKITGFTVKESNAKDGIHMIGLMDYSDCTSSFSFNDNKKPLIGLYCPKYGGANQYYIHK